jgi:hypothetical protein
MVHTQLVIYITEAAPALTVWETRLEWFAQTLQVLRKTLAPLR